MSLNKPFEALHVIDEYKNEKGAVFVFIELT